MESEHYHYRVPWLNYEDTLTAGDSFSISIEFSSYLVDTNTQRLLYLSPPQCIPCHKFLQEGRDFLSTILSSIHFSNEILGKLTDGFMSVIQEMFLLDEVVFPPPSSESQHLEIPLVLEIFRIDDEDEDDDVGEVMEESMLCFQMIPASNEAIKTSLKKSKVVLRNEGCSIRMEELDVNADECCTMPCDHVFHQQCIVTWLKNSHVCPLCRYALPTLED
ncbi:hypothetical protein Fmac_026705 [Flemingia macrophylla]|uniref:RING-type E3 ubiquitin transferase n=1 Tax=Flemingia macrophylla TaxID=520843 RepID=A0ABD1LFT4_9FABA